MLSRTGSLESSEFRLQIRRPLPSSTLYPTANTPTQPPNPVALTNSTNPHLLGFLVKDEPKVSDFALLKNWTAELAITHPGKLRFINLLPNCSAMGTPVMSNASYTEYVRRFAQEVQPDLLAFDMYPEFKKQASLVAYRRTLALFRSLALAHRIPVRRFSPYSHFLW